ncbi:hypothetical protein AMECASPLE_036442 [Ameca splendens]|uniref:Uncharacterized protein n=1 Tax=Ameca splendens TaxID=208324 RepID=A0ABV0Z6U1_9TELE
MIKPIYALWISYPISCLRLDSYQAGSYLLPLSPGPSCKCNLSTLQRKHLHTELIPVRSELTQNSTKKPSTDSPSLNLDPESLYPWRPDHSHL